MGRLVAACTSATMSGSVLIEAIIQPAPTSCIQVPMLEAMEAIHSARKVRLFSKLHWDFSRKTSLISVPALFSSQPCIHGPRAWPT